MASYSEILNEIESGLARGVASSIDDVRQKYLGALSDLTGRSVIVYASAMFEPAKSAGDIAVHAGDKEGFFEVIRDLPTGPVDVIMQSPGGTAEGAEGIVSLLRSKFDDIRYIVPVAAKSAATMLVMSGSAIVMDATSELGPIDPQRVQVRRIGPVSEVITTPVMAIKKSWEQIERDIAADQSRVALWYPIIYQFGPSLLVECDSAIELAKTLVGGWLRAGMLANDHAQAALVVDTLADHDQFGSHARIIDVDRVKDLKLNVVDLRDPANARLRTAVWDAWNAISVTLSNTPVTKIFENHLGKRVIKMRIESLQQAAAPAQPQPQSPARRQINTAIRPRRH